MISQKRSSTDDDPGVRHSGHPAQQFGQRPSCQRRKTKKQAGSRSRAIAKEIIAAGNKPTCKSTANHAFTYLSCSDAWTCYYSSFQKSASTAETAETAEPDINATRALEVIPGGGVGI